MEILQENQEKMMKTIDSLRTRLKGMEANHVQMMNMMTDLLKHHEVQFVDEDVVVEPQI
jgi:hypothetical protein